MVPDHETYAYSASKAGLHHLSRTMGGRLGWEGITSNTIACGQFFSLFPSTLRSMYRTVTEFVGCLGPFLSKSSYQTRTRWPLAVIFADSFSSSYSDRVVLQEGVEPHGHDHTSDEGWNRRRRCWDGLIPGQ